MTRWSTAIAAAAAVALILYLDGPQLLPLATFAAVALLFAGLELHARWPLAGQAAFAVFAVVIALLFAMPVAGIVAENLDELPEWDYLGFWLHARTAVEGGSFYDPANAQRLALPFDVSEAFQHEIVDVGFWYPPPSMFLFWPLGAFADASDALPFWYALHAAAAAIAVLLAWRTFFPSPRAVELLVCAALVTIGHGTYTTFYFAQTNFVALVALLLFWRARGRVAGAVWIPIAAFVKPFVGVVALASLVARRTSAILGMIGAGVILTLASVVAFGPTTFADWLTRGPDDAKPSWIYDEPTNQSLLGLVLRATDAECEGSGCVLSPAYLAGAVVILAVTLFLGVRLQRVGEEEWAIALYLLSALIVYPVSQLFYSVLLLPLVLVAWARRREVAGPALLAVLIAAVFALAAVDWGSTTILGFLLLWLFFAGTGARIARAAHRGLAR